MDAEILAAAAAEQAAMVDLLAELIEAPTLPGEEAAGQAIMRRAFADLGLEPFDVPLDPGALDGHPGAAPFSWDVAGKANVLANWEPAAAADARSLILNGHIDVVSPEPASRGAGRRSWRGATATGARGAAAATPAAQKCARGGGTSSATTPTTS